MSYVKTTALNKILNLKQRIRFVSGGTSSSKTISILMWLIDYCQTHTNEVVSVISESLPHLRKGAIRDFKNIMQTQNYWKENNWLEPPQATYKFESGTILEFFSADQPGKVRGPRRDVLYINEANNISYEVFTQLEVRTKKIVWLDSNPTHEYWIYTEVMPNKKIDFISLTYKDNEALEQSIVESIESRINNKTWYAIYALGQLAESESQIYTGWQLIDEIPHEARLERYGLDFGYTNDPTVIIAIYKYNGGIILDEVAYQTGMKNKMIADLLANLPKSLVIADSSEPKSIDEIAGYGISIIGATKGQGSVNRGIDYVQSQKISITKRSVKTIKAYRNYLWMRDKDEKIINEPDDSIHEWSNSMDALRYGIESFNVTGGKMVLPTEDIGDFY